MKKNVFEGLSAFPLTPMNEEGIDEQGFISFIDHLVEHGVDSIGVLGSTGNYAYLNPEERKRLTTLAIRAARDVPVIVGISSLRTKDVIHLAQFAQGAGASGLLLAPMSYQPLTEEEVFSLYQAVNEAVAIPICVYDNPNTTKFMFSDDLYLKLAELSNVQSFKLPGISDDRFVAIERISALREKLPEKISLGISGDASGVMGLVAGCNVWYSVIGGLFPLLALRMLALVKAGAHEVAFELSAQLRPLWALFSQKGSLRVMATAAEILGKTSAPCLPQPLQTLQGEDRALLEELLKDKELYA